MKDIKNKVRRKLIHWLQRGLPPPPPPKRLGLRSSMNEVLLQLKGLSFKPGTIIDVGFNTGTEGLYGHFPDANYFIVDPLQENEIFMKHQVSQLTRASYALAAAGAEAGEIQIAVTPDFGGSSVYLKGTEAERRSVPIERLDDLVAKQGCAGPYLIKIDVQGAELDVLKGATHLLRQTEVIIAEARFFPFSGSPEIFEVLKFLDEQGFALYDLFNVARRPSDEALGQIDLVAVKKDGFFRTPTTYRSSASYRTAEQRKKNVEGKLRKREAALAQVRAQTETGHSPQT